MQKDATSTKFVARRRLGLLIAIVIALAAIMYWFYAWRTDTLPTAPGKSAPASTLYKTRSTLNSAVEIVVPAPSPPPTKSLLGESGWKAILENLAALLKRDKVEVCGLSDFDAALYIAGDTEVGVAAVNATLAQVTGKLFGSEQPREQALGLYMQAHLAEWARSNAEHSKSRICAGDFECLLKMIASETTPTLPGTRSTVAAPLVKLAMASRDPSVVAAALHACRGIRSGVCESISAAQWTAIEPNNAAIWLMVADEASSRNDMTARDNALRRAAAATEYDTRIPSLASVADSPLVLAQSPLVQFHIGNQLAITNVASAVPSVSALTSYCFHEKKTDHLRNTLCDTLANKLLDRDESLVGLAYATGLGKKLGWDAARLQALKDERAVIEGTMHEVFLRPDMFNCQQLAKTNQWIKTLLTTSERAIARKLVADSGKSLAQLASKYRPAAPGVGK